MILRTIVLCRGFLFSVPAFAFEAGSQAGNVPPEGDSLLPDGAPQGRLEGPFEFRSEILTGTVRRYWVFNIRMTWGWIIRTTGRPGTMT